MKKKKAASKSAFFNPRTLIGLSLCLVALLLGIFAFGGLTGRSVNAATKANMKPDISAPAPQILRGVKPLRTRPLREMPIIPPDMAPGHDHVEPMTPAGPTEGAGVDTARQTTLGPVLSAPTSTGVSFDGVGVGLAGFVPSSNPPDVNGRVGATQYVQWNNTSFAVFNKNTGALLFGPAAGNTLFQALGGVCATHNDGDPVVSYDILSGRWLLSQFVVNGGMGSASHQCVAVSQTSDATGAYYLYDFLTDAANFIDYPHTGVWPDAYYMSAHVFNAAGTAVVAARVYAFERAAMIAGQPARMQSANLTTYGGSFQFGFLPADLDSLTPPPVGEAEFVLGPHPTTLTLTASTRVAVTWGVVPTILLTEATITNTTYATASCVSSGRKCVPQSGQASAAALDNIKGHFMYRLAYRNNGTQASPQESLMANIPVAGAAPAHNAIRWYEFRNAGNSTATPTIFQQSTYDPDTTSYRWLGSMAMDKDGDMALGFSKSSATTFPSISITGRLVGDTINTMGTEVQVQAGAGSQDSTGGNRWGDYSSMTLDPVDQCTFYYTNEYLKTTGAFNWSIRVASYRFPSCTNAPAWGTVSGTVTSCATGAPISGVVVSLDNGFASATDASGNYSILVPAGNYTATAADAARNCATSTPASMGLSVVTGGNTTQNFCMTGTSNLQGNGVTIDDSGGNGNGVINANECVNLKLGVKNNGCATESAISATVTTSTAGVTITQGSATYPNLVIDAAGINSVPFIIQTSNTFSCGTNIALNLNLTYAGGSKTIAYSVPTCSGGPTQSIPPNSIAVTDSSQPDRLGRTGAPSTCSGKACPGPINTAGTRNYKTFNFTNSGAAPACITVNTHAVCGGTADISSAAYLNAYVPPVAQGDAAGNMCLNYLGDSGIVGLGTTAIPNASYNFTVPASSNFVVVVFTNANAATCSEFDATLSGFYDFTSGPGACAAAPVLQSAASRMTHAGGAGTFDKPMPLSGPSGIEPRSAGTGNFTAVMTFNGPVNGGRASVTTGTGSVSSVSFSGNSMIIGLTGVTDQQVVTVTATSVSGPGTGALPSASMSIGFLNGDVNSDRTVNVGDTIQVRGAAGVTLDNTNFQNDVNVDGMVNVGDTIVVRSKSSDFVP